MSDDKVVDLFQRKIDKMSTHELFSETTRYGHIMERGNLTAQEKHEAKLIFENALQRAETEEYRKILRAAIKVLGYM